jgi:hypothetical protein
MNDGASGGVSRGKRPPAAESKTKLTNDAPQSYF